MTTAIPASTNGTHSAGRQAFAELTSILSNKTHDLLRPTPQLQQAVLQAAKSILDPLAAQVADAQLARRSENRKKRKRNDVEEEEQVLQLRQIHTDGFGVKQVWEQARRVLDAAHSEVERQIDQHVSNQASGDLNAQKVSSTADGEPSILDDDDAEADFDDSEDDIQDDDESDEEIELDIEDRDNAAHANADEDEEDIDVDSIDDSLDGENEISTSATYVQDAHGLNDGFFSIDDFNRQSQFLEQMDARGDDDNPSDEDEVDWAADPMTMSMGSTQFSKSSRNDGQALDGSDDGGSDDDDGPTFGNADLNASESGDDMQMDEEGGLDDGMGLSNANDINYADFFEPPPKKPSKTKRMRALPKTQPGPQSSLQNEDALQNDIERAMADVRRDLLDSEEEDDPDDDGGESGSDVGPRKSRLEDKNLSTHEKQKAAIAAEIRRLEAANVAKRDWQLSGEARAAERPLNSLIEEDLEFERAGKPVPVVTAETSEEIEQLIKRRILAREFDEVIRRYATGIGSAQDTRRGRVEVDDSKPQSGLADIYEQEHLKSSDPSAYVDKRSNATKKQHDQIDMLWREVNEQLNMLSNLHFKPKRVDIQMTTVEDKPRIAMEDARPVGDLEAGDGGMLAPQEVYKPGVDSRVGRDEVTVGKGSSGMSREEMTREEKLRRRRREKERTKKAQSNKETIVLSKDGQKVKARRKGKQEEKADIISDLRKGNVKVVGKEGELQNLGKQKKGTDVSRSIMGGNLKL